jgi:ribosomal-protein-alanine N-acetyltransferase
MIARAEASDVDAMAAIEARAHRHPWTREQLAVELALPHSRVTIARVEAQVAGYLVAWLVAGELQILNLCVAPEYRRRGLARALLMDALRDGQTATLEVRRGNVEALALYHACGFREVGTRTSYYHDGEDAILMTWNMTCSPGC